MEVVGKIIQVLPLQSGTSQAGNAWKKQEYILETEEAYPRKICFDFFGDRVDQFPLALNDRVRLSFDIESREYNGRWYTSIRGWKADKITDQPAVAGVSAPMAGASPVPAPPAPDFTQSSDADDLPF